MTYLVLVCDVSVHSGICCQTFGSFNCRQDRERDRGRQLVSSRHRLSRRDKLEETLLVRKSTTVQEDASRCWQRRR